ncbi:MAG: hypothetical protein F6K36_20940 [Symploca sp. SIO3C6]|uniref:Uncharacterized protein n=1 Tax=Symploca sp. SIO1C4 TaxID=2607765 RepID=A0A6B3NGG6_9CYAN|nr:hypothetical protein [Symploca sp. SIO3C6]NER29995.1 hypothetical protein [Symploca sp. SIO1C4]NET05775.1 hypothetical protein [Symploca sp. SIO2B6]
MAVLPALYFSVALYFFSIWFTAFCQDTNLSKQEQAFSLKVLIVATAFWPIVAPISYLSQHLQSQWSPGLESEEENSQTSLSAP